MRRLWIRQYNRVVPGPARPQPFSATSEDYTIRTILEGTASSTGDAFFRALVRNQADALHVRQCWVTEFVEENTRIRALAFWNGTEFLEDFEYELAGTPCERVLDGDFVHHAESVQALYPKDIALADMRAESYVGVPLVHDERVLGHLAVMDDRRIEAHPTGLSVFYIFAARAAAELWRLRVERDLRILEGRVSGIVESAMDGIVALDERFEIELFNPSAQEMLGLTSEDALGRSFEQLLSPESKLVFDRHIKTLRASGRPAARSRGRHRRPGAWTLGYWSQGKGESFLFKVAEKRLATAAFIRPSRRGSRTPPAVCLLSAVQKLGRSSKRPSDRKSGGFRPAFLGARPHGHFDTEEISR